MVVKSVPQIAMERGVTDTTVRNHLKRTIAAMRKEAEAEGLDIYL